MALLPHPSLFGSMLGAMLRGAGWGSYFSRAPCFLHDLRDPRPSALPTPAAPTPRRAPFLALAPVPGPITLLGTAGTRGRTLQRASWCLPSSIPPEPQGYPQWHLLSQACPALSHRVKCMVTSTPPHCFSLPACGGQKDDSQRRACPEPTPVNVSPHGEGTVGCDELWIGDGSQSWSISGPTSSRGSKSEKEVWGRGRMGVMGEGP